MALLSVNYECRDGVRISIPVFRDLGLNVERRVICVLCANGSKRVPLFILKEAFRYFARWSGEHIADVHFAGLALNTFNCMLQCFVNGRVAVDKENCAAFEHWAEYLELLGFRGNVCQVCRYL